MYAGSLRTTYLGGKRSIDCRVAREPCIYSKIQYETSYTKHYNLDFSHCVQKLEIASQITEAVKRVIDGR